MGQLLSHPLTEKTIDYNDYQHRVSPQLSTLVPRFYNCVGSMQGYRLTQEDAHLVLNEESIMQVKFYNPFKETTQKLILSVFAVFDGHGGEDCSNFISGGGSNPKNGLAKWISYSFENHKYGAWKGDGPVNNSNGQRKFRTLQGLISQVIKDAFLLQDNELYKYFFNSSCGSTAIVTIIINGEYMYVANCGDSRCILSSKGNGVKTMSFDHKPQHIGELIRINDNGGTVSLGRVGGVLALSRAFGDFQFKRGVTYSYAKNKPKFHNVTHNGNTPAQESQVTAEPDVVMHKIDYKKDEFLILACDGIWDVYSNKQLCKFVKFHLTAGVKLDGIVTKMLDHGIAQANSSTGVGFDNMTVIIIALNKSGESLSDWYTKMKIRLEREKGLI
ncbi:hypothetical protein NCAS_0I00940 [Naumovozyma castellii]|uniref:protein-serine/threonine phosphatase n=1 Tax=Naumovozyma castellii TaxID=27288 RepID=G0VJT1_NAUCA|nr:hypothetical protein NCAS_0I00940 [Naumovozyma castellii CBS 4309]CCC71762.1 hypothetical protein NCAS_0I00940 [Naumovozyma castellii CBS 4309]